MMRWVVQHGVPLVTASDRTDYDEADLSLFGFNLTEQEMATFDAWAPRCSANKRQCKGAVADCLNQGCETCSAGGKGCSWAGSCGCASCCAGCSLQSYGGVSFCQNASSSSQA